MGQRSSVQQPGADVAVYFFDFFKSKIFSFFSTGHVPVLIFPTV